MKIFEKKKFDKKKEKNIRAISEVLIGVLDDKCLICNELLKGHIYAMIASKTWNKQESKNGNIGRFVALLESHNWKEIRKYQEFDAHEDVAEVFFLRCKGKSKVLVLLIRNPDELYDSDELLTHYILDETEIEFLYDTPSNISWNEL